MKTVKNFKVYRYYNTIAFHTDTGPTQYMDKKTAHAFLNAVFLFLNELDRDVPFSKSQVGNVQYPPKQPEIPPIF